MYVYKYIYMCIFYVFKFSVFLFLSLFLALFVPSSLSLLCFLSLKTQLHNAWKRVKISKTLQHSATYCNIMQHTAIHTGAGRVETSEDVDLDIGSEITFSIKW